MPRAPRRRSRATRCEPTLESSRSNFQESCGAAKTTQASASTGDTADATRQIKREMHPSLCRVLCPEACAPQRTTRIRLATPDSRAATESFLEVRRKCPAIFRGRDVSYDLSFVRVEKCTIPCFYSGSYLHGFPSMERFSERFLGISLDLPATRTSCFPLSFFLFDYSKRFRQHQFQPLFRLHTKPFNDTFCSPS